VQGHSRYYLIAYAHGMQSFRGIPLKILATWRAEFFVFLCDRSDIDEGVEGALCLRVPSTEGRPRHLRALSTTHRADLTAVLLFSKRLEGGSRRRGQEEMPRHPQITQKIQTFF
jgi:hypothetical protein